MNYKDIPIGIDLGTTYSCIGAFRNGIVEIIPNQITGRTTPSVVSFCGKEISIGEQTQNRVFSDPEKVIYAVKRIIGKKFTESNFNKLICNLAYKNKITRSSNDRPIINVDFNGKEQKYFPEEISAMVLKRLKENAETFLSQKIKKVVITIPAYFNEAQREATKIAGEGAGLEVIKIINEPTAAALAYGIGERNDLQISEEDVNIFLPNKEIPSNENFDEKKVLVFDLGGGTFDVTCLKIIKDDEEPQFDILFHYGDIFLGGEDFDNILVEYCLQKFKKEYKIDINTRNTEDIKARKRLKIACERAKRILSYELEARINIESLYDDKDLQLNITRAKFEDLCKEKFKEMINPIKIALDRSGMEKEEIDEILLVGGSTRIPRIEKEILDFFGEEKKICKSINPDEVVAYGATLQAANSMKAEAMRDILINDVCSHSIGVAIIKGINSDYFNKMIENGTNIPYEIEQEYTTYHDNQSSALIQIFEGENEFCRNNRLLGKFRLENISKAKRGVPKLMVKIKFDEDSILHVTAYEKISGAINKLDIEYDKGIMDQDEIKKMKEKLENKEDYEKNKINKKEKYFSEKKRLLIDDFKKTKNLQTLKELEKVQEELIDISLDEYNKNNFEKKYKNVKFLFLLYNFLFKNNYNEYVNLSNEYLKKIKRYMEIFKEDDAYYIKSLVLIFKEDKYYNRISQIVFHSINLYFEYLKKAENKKFSSYYYSEILRLIEIFREKINFSNLKFKFDLIERDLKIEKNKLIIEIEEKIKYKYNIKDLTLDEGVSAIDQYAYVIERVGNINEKGSEKEKAFRAYLIAKLINLELYFFKKKDLTKLNNMAEEALKLANECHLTKDTDDWITTLIGNKQIIEQKIKDEGKKTLDKTRNSFGIIMEKEIKGNNDDENIKFLELLNKEFVPESINSEDIKQTYKDNPDKLLRRYSKIINNLPNEEKENKNWTLTQINKMKKFIKYSSKKKGNK